MENWFSLLPAPCNAPPAHPVKETRLFLVRHLCYHSNSIKQVSGRIDLIVEKVSTKGQHTIVWDKKLDRKYLSQYPSVENALKQIITIHNLNREKEYLIVHYILTYNSKGSELQMQNCTIMKYNNPGKIDISIWSVHIITIETRDKKTTASLYISFTIHQLLFLPISVRVCSLACAVTYLPQTG